MRTNRCPRIVVLSAVLLASATILPLRSAPADPITYYVLAGRDTLGTEIVSIATDADGKLEYTSRVDVDQDAARVQATATTTVDPRSFRLDHYDAIVTVEGTAGTQEFSLSVFPQGNGFRGTASSQGQVYSRDFDLGADPHLIDEGVVHHFAVLVKRLAASGWLEDPRELTLPVIVPAQIRDASYLVTRELVEGAGSLGGQPVTTWWLLLRRGGDSIHLIADARTEELLMIITPSEDSWIIREGFQPDENDFPPLGEDTDSWLEGLRELIIEDHGSFVSDDFEIGYTVAQPREHAGDLPGVVLIHGSGPLDRDLTIGANKPFRDLAHALAARGVVVLRYDKRTFAHHASMSPETMSLESVVLDDARVAYEALRAHPDTDSDRIYLAGHSLGGRLAPFMGNQVDACGLVVLSGSATSILEQVREQMASRLAQAGADRSTVSKRLGELDARLKPLIDRSAPTDRLVMGATARYWYAIEDADPIPEVMRFGGPILVLRGSDDDRVTEVDHQRWLEAVAGRDHAGDRVHLVNGANHLMLPSGEAAAFLGYPRSVHIHETFIDEIARFVRASGGER